MRKTILICGLACLVIAGCYATPEEEVYIRDIRKGREIIAKADELFDRGKFFKAYQEYERGLKYYPDNPRRHEIVEKEITQIGYPYLDGKIKHGLFGTRLLASPRREKGVSIIQDIVRTHLGRKYKFMHNAQYKVATYLFEAGENARAAHEFKYLLENFKDSSWTTISEFLLAESYYRENMGPKYDQGTLDDAAYHFKRYVTKVETSATTDAAERVKISRERLRTIHLLKAEKIYINAMFYLRRENYRAARYEMQKILADYGDTEWAAKAGQRLGEIKAALKEEA